MLVQLSFFCSVLCLNCDLDQSLLRISFFSLHSQGCIVPFSRVIWKLYERNSLPSFIIGYDITIVFDVVCSFSVAHYSGGIQSLAVLHMDGQTTLEKNYRNHREIILTKMPLFLPSVGLIF